ncbi:MAG: hypothetical protein DRR16_19220 [Candidatus Parabeggiatoa sp. nov. 3]|nr:MAG: hypothetical protein DRR00_17460 [Gammaproteobacteria bacterium]RKZ64475.1 MAG: hypothetical protein DRQ99_15465 [Gammaproteobacteria bacterium]RKZ82658.1 MAG: hypothetical protein DRR16_19220 [Gammaproteobacteria bacterium]
MKFYLLSFTFLFALIGCWDDAEPEIHNDKKQASEKSESQITAPTETPDNLGNQADKDYWQDEEQETPSEKEALKSDEKEAEQTGSRSEDDEEAQYLLELDQQAERFSEQAQ